MRRLFFLLLLVAALGRCGAADSRRDAAGLEVRADLSAGIDVPTLDKVQPETVDAIEMMPAYPRDDALRLNHVQVKGTHNSYHLLPDEAPVPEWLYEHASLPVQLAEFGVRQVELDVHWDGEAGLFRVYHVPILDDNSSCDTFVECLQLLKDWSDGHPGHHALFVLVEPKDDIDPESIVGHYEELDAEILSVWPRERLLVPDDVRGDHETLAKAVTTAGWPTLGESRDRALFLMLDSGIHKENYLAPDANLSGRPIFVRGKAGEPWCTFIEIGNAQGHEEEIRELVEAGYMVRTATDSTDPDKAANNPDRAAAAVASGAHLLSTDFPDPAQQPFHLEIPDGTPSRCNPVSAPEWCTSLDVENLGFD